MEHPFWDSPFCLITDELFDLLIDLKTMQQLIMQQLIMQ